MIRELLRSKDTFATPIVLFLISDLGYTALEFEPETIADRLREIEPDVDESLIERVNAALGLYTSNLFWTDPITFGIVCRALNRAKFPAGDEPSVGDIAWGVTEAALLTRDVIDEEPEDRFDESIIKYVKYSLKLIGMYSTPQSLIDYFGEISSVLSVDDPAIAEARQTESDDMAEKVDVVVATKMKNLLLQIKSLGIQLSHIAEHDLEVLLKDPTYDDRTEDNTTQRNTDR